MTKRGGEVPSPGKKQRGPEPPGVFETKKKKGAQTSEKKTKISERFPGNPKRKIGGGRQEGKGRTVMERKKEDTHGISEEKDHQKKLKKKRD